MTQCSRSYAPEFSRPSFAEMDPEIFFRAVQAVSRSAADSRRYESVEAVCLSSHGETFIPVDSAGNPLHAAILNIDTRAAEEAAWFEQQIGRGHLFERTGHTSHTMYPVPKLLWLRKHEPELFRRGSLFLGVISYIFLRLGLPPYIDYSLASRFMAFDVRGQCWSEEILALMELDKDSLPVPVPAGTVAGKLSPEAARELGVSEGTRIIVGGHDQACGSLGVGASTSGQVSDSMGTYECIAAVSNEPQLSEKALAYSLNSYCHVVPEKFITLAYFPAGIMLQWFRDLLYRDDPIDFSDGDEDARYRDLELLAPQHPTGLFVLPYLIGTCNPDFNPHARGAILGLTRSSDRGHLYRGILEGVACELAAMTAMFEPVLGPFADIYATGGGARSPLGMRLRAAITGRSFHLMNSAESVCLGGAILAAVAMGFYPTISDAVNGMVRQREIVEPDLELTCTYRPIKKKYDEVRSVLSRFQTSVAIPLFTGADTWSSQR